MCIRDRYQRRVHGIVSLPVFCDSGFVILSPLNKALSKRSKITLATGAIALSLGLYATHTMVPPTPGPVAAAGILGADLGLVILWGIVVSLVALIGGWLFAVLVASRVYIDPDAEIINDETTKEVVDVANRQPVSYTHLTLPTILLVQISVVAVSLKKKKNKNYRQHTN
eukprot:TRINITY_DN30421_c0_g1_i1.p1 TRINITY_DN30421_c0_g1~~TRINITY_DN30421_c0_g1_i1.p1  ORF type:complete len:169 (+),score=30.74 TRINITY_DN30421_c0_g1_i1:168-674(+)